MPKKIVSLFIILIVLIQICTPFASAATVAVNEVPKGNEYFNAMYVYVDIYLDDITELRAHTGKGVMATHAKDANALVAINGDWWNYDIDTKIIVRNGVLKHEWSGKKHTRDYCVIYNNGTMQTYKHQNVTHPEYLYNNAWQIFTFGPVLVHHGEAIKDFSDTYSDYISEPSHPRTAIGYFEPNHFCFLTVFGRNIEDKGTTLVKMAHFFEDIGCQEAYNLDGGGSTHIWYNGKELGHPSKDAPLGDIIYIPKDE